MQASPVNEKMTLKRVVDFVKDRGDENLKDINRKLQRMLEETLTKNMHLQKVGRSFLLNGNERQPINIPPPAVVLWDNLWCS